MPKGDGAEEAERAGTGGQDEGDEQAADQVGTALGGADARVGVQLGGEVDEGGVAGDSPRCQHHEQDDDGGWRG